MTNHSPPAPPEATSPNGPGEGTRERVRTSADDAKKPVDQDRPERRGDPANLGQNTRHQGYQQDR